MLITAVKFLLDPFNILWLLIGLAAVFYFLEKTKLFRYSLGSILCWLLITSTPLVPNLLLSSLESHFVPVQVSDLSNTEQEYHIIILGGGHGYDDRLPPNSLLSLNALGRLNEGIRLHRQLPNSKLVLSGYSSSGRTTQAEMLQNTAILLGVNEVHTLIQMEPANTHQEAQVYASNYGNSHPVILVTSAAHMPRAMFLFDKFGIVATPSPANFRLKGSRKRKRIGLPSMNNINNLNAALSEYAGIFQAKYLL